MAAAIIMAGGRSSRMRSTNGPTHKALVPVLGMPMLERNLRAVFGQDFDDVTVAVAAGETAIASYVEQHGNALARRFGANLKVLTEKTPLGTIGAARVFAG